MRPFIDSLLSTGAESSRFAGRISTGPGKRRQTETEFTKKRDFERRGCEPEGAGVRVVWAALTCQAHCRRIRSRSALSGP
jgi:hypothetical protein